MISQHSIAILIGHCHIAPRPTYRSDPLNIPFIYAKINFFFFFFFGISLLNRFIKKTMAFGFLFNSFIFSIHDIIDLQIMAREPSRLVIE